MREDALPQPVSPYGVTQAGGRAAVLPVSRQLRRAGRVAPLLHGLWTAPAAGHGLPQVPAGHAPGRADHASTATANRPATSRSWDAVGRDQSAAAARGVPGRVYNIGGGSRVSINQVLEHDRSRLGPPAVSSRPIRLKRATCGTPMPTRRSRADRSGVRAANVTLEEGLAAEYRWLVGHAVIH